MGLSFARKGSRLIGVKKERAAARAVPPAEGRGDELQELAETFRWTVRRLSSLVRELEEAHRRELQVEQEKKRFYRDVIRAVTQGKFELVDAEEIPEPGGPVFELPVRDAAEYAAARQAVRDAARAAAMPEEREADLLLAAGEIITNAMKHAEEGCLRIYRTDDAVHVRVTDAGAGIGSQHLPSALLMPGFSTKISLGMGYKMLLRLCDTVWLATGPEGTTVQVKKNIHASPADDLFPGLMDRF
jgi:anti-sigma regulatory factor (Ser/Thr protein kinase)